MSRKNRLNFKTLTNGDMSLSSVVSSVTSIQFLDNVGVQAIWAGSSPVGTVSIEVSADYSQDFMGNVINAGHWVAITAASTAVTGNTGSDYIDLNQLSTPWVRARYTKTSGTGLINIYITAKMI